MSKAGIHLSGRIATSLVSVAGAMLVIFILISVVPGDPATTLLGAQATPEFARQFVVEMGLDQPFYVRLWRFFSHLALGDLGTDVVTGRSVNAIVWSAIPGTFTLAFGAMALACLLGIPTGILCAVRRGSLIDHAVAGFSVIFVSIPSFILGVFLLVVFSVWLDWLPVLGATEETGFAEGARRLVLPILTLALGWIGIIARLVRTSMLETLNQDYIRTARAYGLPERLVLYKYALKNAVIPALAIIGIGIGRLLGGAVLVEILFARPGLGTVLYNALSARNFSVMQGAIFVVVLIFVAVNLIVELGYALVDPRIRLARR